MKKIKNKISFIGLSLLLILTSINNVFAYEIDVNLDNSNIVMNQLYQNTTNYISLQGTLANNNSAVYQQYVSITKEQFDTLNKKLDEYISYSEKTVNENNELYTQLNTKKTEVATLKAKADDPSATEEDVNAYNKANTELTTLSTKYDTALKNYDIGCAKYESEIKALVPIYDDTKWNNLSLLSSENNVHKYKVDFPTEIQYMVSWVKVSLNNQDYYNYDIYCSFKQIEKEEETSTNVVTEETTTETNPKTGIIVNYVYALLIILVALSSYVVVRKFRRFSK